MHKSVAARHRRAQFGARATVTGVAAAHRGRGHSSSGCGDAVSGAVAITYDSATDPELAITPLDGKIDLKVAAVDVAAYSPDNTSRYFAFDVELYIPAGVDPEYVVPLFKGRVTLAPRVVLL